jgi:hypothetical protein
MRDPRLRELMTDGQSGMARTNDDNVNSIAHDNLDPTSHPTISLLGSV